MVSDTILYRYGEYKTCWVYVWSDGYISVNEASFNNNLHLRDEIYKLTLVWRETHIDMNLSDFLVKTLGP